MSRQAAPPKRSRSVAPYVFLAIAIVSVAASGMLWKHRHDTHPKQGTRVIATKAAPSSELAITAFNAPSVWHCSPGGDNSVLLSWSTTGAQSVEIAVANAAKPLFTGQAPASQVSVPAPCAPESRTYQLIATSADGKHTVTKSATTRGV